MLTFIFKLFRPAILNVYPILLETHLLLGSYFPFLFIRWRFQEYF